MTRQKDGGPAYPCKTYPATPEEVRALRDAAGVGLMEAKGWATNHPGMSLRDAAALAALQGMLSSGDWAQYPPIQVAERAFDIADAFLDARRAGEQARDKPLWTGSAI